MFTCFLMMQLEFSETGEFCKAVRAKDEGESMDLPSVQYKQHKAEAERMGAQRGGDGKGVKEEPRTRTKTEEGEEGGFEEEEEDAEEEETWAQKRAQSGEDRDLLHERSAGGGLGAVLDIARGRGLLGEEHESSGRMFDQKGAGLHNYDTKEADQETTFQLQVHSKLLTWRLPLHGMASHTPGQEVVFSAWCSRWMHIPHANIEIPFTVPRRIWAQDDAEAGVPTAVLEVSREGSIKKESRETHAGGGEANGREDPRPRDGLHACIAAGLRLPWQGGSPSTRR